TISVHGGTATGPVLRSRGGTYSDLGDLISLDIDTGTGAGIATSSLEYDAFGNLARVVSPPNEAGERQSHTYTLDAVTHHYVATVTDGFGLTSSTDYDLRFCEPAVSRDANGSTFTRTYDDFGRMIRLRGPYDGADAAIEMSYRPDARPPFATT